MITDNYSHANFIPTCSKKHFHSSLTPYPSIAMTHSYVMNLRLVCLSDVFTMRSLMNVFCRKFTSTPSFLNNI